MLYKCPRVLSEKSRWKLIDLDLLELNSPVLRTVNHDPVD